MNQTLKRLLVTLKLRKPDPVPAPKQEWLSDTADRWHAKARLQSVTPTMDAIMRAAASNPDAVISKGRFLERNSGPNVNQHSAYPVPDMTPLRVQADPVVIDWPVRQEATIWTPEPSTCSGSSYSNDNSSDSGSSCSASE